MGWLAGLAELPGLGWIDRLPNHSYCRLSAHAQLFAAIIHDIGHPGLNNVWHVKSNHPVAIRCRRGNGGVGLRYPVHFRRLCGENIGNGIRTYRRHICLLRRSFEHIAAFGEN